MPFREVAVEMPYGYTNFGVGGTPDQRGQMSFRGYPGSIRGQRSNCLEMLLWLSNMVGRDLARILKLLVFLNSSACQHCLYLWPKWCKMVIFLTISNDKICQSKKTGGWVTS